VTPKQTPIPQAKKPTPTKPTPTISKPPTPAKPKPVAYTHAHKEPFGKALKENFPKEMIPGKITGYAIGVIFLVVIIIGVIQFPLSSLMSGNADIQVKIGLPWPFLIFDLANPADSPIQIANLIYDVLIYLAISYAISIALNLVLSNPLLKSAKQNKLRPKVFEIKQKETLTDKAVKKITGAKTIPTVK